MIIKNNSELKNELFTKNSFIPKLVLSVLIPIIFFSVTALLPANDEYALIYMLGITFVCTALYLVPFVANALHLKSNPNESLKKLVVSDLIFSMLPACFSTAITACVFYLFGDGGDSNNIFVIILCVVFLITPPFAWCFYWLKSKLSKLSKRLINVEQLLQDEQELDN